MTARGFVLRLIDNFSHRKIFYVLPALLMGALGVMLLIGQIEYKSEGKVFVESETFLSRLTEVRTDGDFNFLTPADVANDQLWGLIQTDSFVIDVLNRSGAEDRLRLPGQSNESLLSNVRDSISSTAGGENFVEISATAAEPTTARDLATATIETYVLWQINSDVSQSQIAETFIGELIPEYTAEIQTSRENLTNWISTNPGPIDPEQRPLDQQLELRSLQDDILAAETRFNSAVSKREDARLASAQAEADVRQGFLVVDQPQLPAEPENGPFDLVSRAVVFSILGLIIAGLVLVFTSASDQTVRFPGEVEELLDVKLLAVVPDLG